MALATIGFSQGQGQQRPARPSAEEMIKKATLELDLTSDQVKAWQAIHKKYEKPDSDRKKAEESRMAMSKELEATLNEKQKEKFKKMLEGQARPPRGGGGR